MADSGLTGGFERDIAMIGRIDAVPSILDIVCQTTGMGFAAVSRVTSDRWIACRVLDRINFGLTSGGELKVETTICDEIRDSLQYVVIDDVATDAVYCDHHTPALYGLRSYISIPIILRNGEFFGTLCAIDPRPAKLNTPEIIGMFKMFADLIAFHLEAQERAEISEAALMDERKTAELREQFIAVLGHDLRNPLSSISAGAALLRKAPEKAPYALTLIERSIQRMAGLVDNVLDFARGRLGGGLTLERDGDRRLQPDLEQVIEELRATWSPRVIQTHFALDRLIYCDRRRIAQLLSNLVANALTYGHADQAIEVDVRIDGDWFVLTVANRGDPIPEETRERLFHPFFRGEKRASAQGLGLGLFIVSEIARAHDGELDVSSTQERTFFTFRMPIVIEPALRSEPST